MFISYVKSCFSFFFFLYSNQIIDFLKIKFDKELYITEFILQLSNI